MSVFKVQLAITSTEEVPPALLYDKSREPIHVDVDELPERVVAVVRAKGGKAFFWAKNAEHGFVFGDEVPDPGW